MDAYFPFPLTKGVYDTSPKMAKLYAPNGETTDEMPEFVFDTNFEIYIAQKIRNLSHLSNRYRVFDENHSDFCLVARTIIELFACKAPHECTLDQNGAIFSRTGIAIDLASGALTLSSSSSKLSLVIMDFLSSSPMPIRLFDALALHIQEDFAITARKDGHPLPNDFLEFAHICFPSHWDPRKKINKSFYDIHAPVANNEKLLKANITLVNSMMERGPFTRFVWGLARSDDLDRHPEHINETAKSAEKSSSLIDQFFLRVERQVTYPLREIARSFFTIRVFVKSLREVATCGEHRRLLGEALLSMNAEALAYKGLTADRDDLVAWLFAD